MVQLTMAFWMANMLLWALALIANLESYVPLLGSAAVAIVVIQSTLPSSGAPHSAYRYTWISAGVATVFVWTWIAAYAVRNHEPVGFVDVSPGSELRLSFGASGICLIFVALGCMANAYLRRKPL
jgi:hypothetical protein